MRPCRGKYVMSDVRREGEETREGNEEGTKEGRDEALLVDPIRQIHLMRQQLGLRHSERHDRCLHNTAQQRC